jgi:hypothetical protein
MSRVVDHLEAVEVDEQQGEPAAAPARLLDRDIHAIGEQRTVGQAGERVVMGEMPHVLLGESALRLADEIVERERYGRTGAHRRLPDVVCPLREAAAQARAGARCGMDHALLPGPRRIDDVS